MKKPAPVVLDESCDRLEPQVREFAPTLVFRRTKGYLADPKVASQELGAVIAASDPSSAAVYVAASFGAFTGLCFAAEHGHRLAGLVLVDPSHPDQVRRAVEILETGGAGGSAAAEAFRAYLPDRAPEWWTLGCARVSSVCPLGDLPLIVLTASEPEVEGPIERRLYEQLVSDRVQQLRSYAALSTSGEVRVVPGVGHGIALQSPMSVISAIRDVLGSVQRHAERSAAP